MLSRLIGYNGSQICEAQFCLAYALGKLGFANLRTVSFSCLAWASPINKNLMKTLKEQDYTINICTDIIEWAKEFYEMPDGAELANEEEVSSEFMGFAQLDDKLVWVFVPKEYDLKDLKGTIAHEIGHIVEMQYSSNPEQIEENDELHEMKADHYMNFYLLVDKIVTDIVGALSGN